MWIKNKNTGLKWEVTQERYDELMKTGDYQPVEEVSPAETRKQKPAASNAKPH